MKDYAKVKLDVYTDMVKVIASLPFYQVSEIMNRLNATDSVEICKGEIPEPIIDDSTRSRAKSRPSENV